MDLLHVTRIASAWLAAKVCSRINLRSERGATAVEYGIMVALIAAVIIVAVQLIGTQLNTKFCFVAEKLGSKC